MARIAHLSDIHFTEASPEALAAAQSALAALRPDCIVITGDVTDGGRRREFAAAAQWIGALPSPVVACPGNHDAPVLALHERFTRPFARFDRLAVGGFWADFWADGAQRAAVAAVNSARGAQARLDWSQGVYREADFRAAARAAAAAAPAGWRVVACHHPPTAPDGARIAVRTRGAAAALRTLAGTPRTVLLCGHVHRFTATAAAADRPAIVTAPTLASRRERDGGQGFALIDLAPDAMVVTHMARAGAEMVAREQVRIAVGAPSTPAGR